MGRANIARRTKKDKQERHAEVVMLLKEGKVPSEVCALTGYSRNRVLSLAGVYNIEYTKEPKPTQKPPMILVDPPLHAKVLEMLRAEESCERIEKATGYTPYTIRKIGRKHGFEFPRKPAGPSNASFYNPRRDQALEALRQGVSCEEVAASSGYNLATVKILKKALQN